MPLPKESFNKLTPEELFVIVDSDVFLGQRKEILEYFQGINNLDYDTFKKIHHSQGCKTVYALRGYSESPFVDTDLFIPQSYKHLSFWCRNHGVTSEIFYDLTFPEEPSTLAVETNRYNFVRHIIEKKSTSENIVEAWSKFEAFILSWSTLYEGLHYCADYCGTTGSISPFRQKIQLGVSSLQNQEDNNENLLITVGLFFQTIFGVDESLGVLLETLTDDERENALLFCKEMLPKGWIANNTALFESINWDSIKNIS